MEREGEWQPGYPLLLEARSFLELGPGWAVLCGALASRGLVLGLEAVLPFALSILLADVFLGGIWSQSMTLASTPPHDQRIVPRAPRVSLPFTLPGSPGHRTLLWVQRNWGHWRALPSSVREAWIGWGLAVVFALALALTLGPSPTLIALSALSLLAVEFGRRRRGLPASWQLAVAQRGAIPWLLGYAALGGPSWGALSSTLSVGIGMHAQALLWSGLYALAMYGHQHLERGQLQAGGRALNTAQGVGIAALIAAREPVLAGIAGLLYLPQGLWQAVLARRRDGPWYRRRTQPYVMAVMLLGALSLAL